MSKPYVKNILKQHEQKSLFGFLFEVETVTGILKRVLI
jgi:hypothetical protein